MPDPIARLLAWFVRIDWSGPWTTKADDGDFKFDLPTDMTLPTWHEVRTRRDEI